MNRKDLESLLPHRDGMLLLDEATRDGDVARGVYTVRGDEWFLQGHFPNSPVVPGVILCEILAQTVCVLLQNPTGEPVQPLYTGLNKIRFRQVVRPGDRIETACRIQKARPPFYFAEGSAEVNGMLCINGEFSFAVSPPCS